MIPLAKIFPPVTLPIAEMPIDVAHALAVLLNNHLAYSPPTGPTAIPLLLAAAAEAALLANWYTKSLVTTVLELIVVVVP